jgi:hypothetical protein
MAYYEDNFENGECIHNFIFLGQATVYPSWTPAMPVYAATVANRGYGNYGQQATSPQFGHHASPFVGASVQRSGHIANTKASRALISNDDEVKQDWQSFHLPKLVSVNGLVADQERVLSQSISQIILTNNRKSTKYSVLLYIFNKFLLANYAARSKVTVFDMLESTSLFSFTAMKLLRPHDQWLT